MQSRLISGYKVHESSDEATQTMSDVFTTNIEELQKTAADEREAIIYFGVLKDKHRVIRNPKEAAKRQEQIFCTRYQPCIFEKASLTLTCMIPGLNQAFIIRRRI